MVIFMNSWVLFLENLLSDRAFPAKYGTSKSKISPCGPHHGGGGGGGGSGRYYIIMHPKPNTHPSALNFKLLPCPKKSLVARLYSTGNAGVRMHNKFLKPLFLDYEICLGWMFLFYVVLSFI